MTNRRRHVRRTARYRATIHTADQHFAGVLENISSDGACVVLVRAEALPRTFTISIPAESIERRCHLVWRDGQHIGVRFD